MRFMFIRRNNKLEIYICGYKYGSFKRVKNYMIDHYLKK